MINLNHIQRIYFLGIGGIGMSALARYFHMQGKTVTGYDRVSTRVSQGLEAEGILVFYQFEAKQLQDQEMIIYTPAILPKNPEYKAAVDSRLPLFKRAEVLGVISQTYKALAVAGTHGKTTTTSMLTHVLKTCEIDCSAFLGGISLNLNSNFAHGKSPWVVIEADEYDRSFLHLHPEMAVLTALDPDHLDIYGSPEEMEEAYFQFASQVAQPLLIHERLAEKPWGRTVETYGVEKGDYQGKNLQYKSLLTTFDYVGQKVELTDLQLRMPGEHNVSNMVGALALAERLGAEPDQMAEAVHTFLGIYRRFEVQVHHDMLTYIDDYAHHPAELEAVIKTARNLFPNRQLMVIFQPHLYTRTRDFSQGFGAALSLADVVLLMDIYPARELPIAGVDSQLILDEIRGNGHRQIIHRTELREVLQSNLKPPAVCMTLGAGDIDKEVGSVRKWAEGVIRYLTN